MCPVSEVPTPTALSFLLVYIVHWCFCLYMKRWWLIYNLHQLFNVCRFSKSERTIFVHFHHCTNEIISLMSTPILISNSIQISNLWINIWHEHAHLLWSWTQKAIYESPVVKAGFLITSLSVLSRVTFRNDDWEKVRSVSKLEIGKMNVDDHIDTLSHCVQKSCKTV